MLKIIAIFFIAINHVLNTLRGDPSSDFALQRNLWVLDFTSASTDIQIFLLQVMSLFGAIGNDIFFIASAWFLCSSNICKKKKILYMLADIWIVSVIILGILKASAFPITTKLIIKSILPTTFANNWYVTCYILFYIVHPALNFVIEKLEKRTHLAAALILDSLYLGINFIQYGEFFANEFFIWVAIYFTISYIKKYKTQVTRNELRVMLFSSICAILIFDYFLNIAGLHVSALNGKMLHFDSLCNPFALVLAISLFLLALQNKTYHSKLINYIASLSLLIYIIHENILVRTYLRPLMWLWIKKNFGYSYILAWCIILAGAVFLGATVLSVLYKETVQKLCHKVCDRVYPVLQSKWNRLLDKYTGI